MAFKLVVSKNVRANVAGSLRDEDGKPVKFEFVLLGERVDGESLAGRSVGDVLRQKVHGWDGVQDADGIAIPYSVEALDRVMNITGMAMVMYQALLDASSAEAKAKNY